MSFQLLVLSACVRSTLKHKLSNFCHIHRSITILHQPKLLKTVNLLDSPSSTQFLLKNVQKLSSTVSFIRYKTYKKNNWDKKKSPEYYSDSDLDSDDELFEDPKLSIPGSKVIQIQMDSLRCDLVLKNGLGIPRNKLEMQFYEGRFRLNGKKVLKKSAHVNVGDEVDLIKNIDEENPKLLHIGRVEVFKIRPTGDNIIMMIRKYKNLLIENYEEDPWEEKLESGAENET